jgi:hypothetical protein
MAMRVVKELILTWFAHKINSFTVLMLIAYYLKMIKSYGRWFMLHFFNETMVPEI